LRKKEKMKNKPVDTKLYAKVVQEAKKKFMVWPSAYASGWVVRTYKSRGGRYETSSSTNTDDRPLKRWFNEKWVDVCEYVEHKKIKECGRKHADWKDYPYCRPYKRESPQTPMTLHELIEKHGISQVRNRCAKKKNSPSDKILPRK
jgi:hypothetical protein